MMRATHVIGGCAAWLAVCAAASPPAVVTLAGTVAAGVAAPLCDIDNVGAWASRRRGSRRRAHPWKYRAARVIAHWGAHRRGPCHSFIVTACAAVLLAAPVLLAGWWPWAIAAAMGTGWWSHIALDLANAQPVRAFWPFGPLIYGLGFRVGRRGELWLIRPAAAAAVALLALVTLR
jgi:membrane-bound metal-dependent hydrolase YbcI (DUF457 family)